MNDAPAPTPASPTTPEIDCRFQTVTRYFEGPVIARCLGCGWLVGIEEIGEQIVTMPCGITWTMNARSILEAGQ